MGNDMYRELGPTILASPLLRPIIDAWDKLSLPDCWMVAGAIAQTVWNETFGLPSAHGISDLDIVYFDGDDLSERGEAQHAARIRATFAHLPVWIDVKNQARVHTWYQDKFGYPVLPYTSTADAITSFPTTATAIGLQPTNGSLVFDAPFGIDDLMAGVVRPNRKQITRAIYEAKVHRWLAHWPLLAVLPWDEP